MVGAGWWAMRGMRLLVGPLGAGCPPLPLTHLLKLAFPSRAKDMKNRLGIFRRRNESPGANPSGKLDKVLKSLK